MSAAGKLNVSTDPRMAAPMVQLTRIEKIVTVEVMVTELQQVEEAATEEKTALAFATLCAGAFVSALLSIPSSDASAKRWAIYTALTALSVVGTLWFSLMWLRKRKYSARILEGIRARAGTVQQTLAFPAGALPPSSGSMPPP